MTGQVAEAPSATVEETDLLTVGVEEEFLLVDPHTGTAVPAVDLVMEQVPPELRGQVEREFQTSQIEIGSPPGLELSSIRHSLGMLRVALADAAERAGVRLLAIGTGPVDGPVPPVVDKPRFDRMIERFRLLVPGPGNNGMHVHVGVPDPETGVQVLNHVRPWLPVLQAVTVNSPFAKGEDTGYASWRSVEWEHWPSVAPTPFLESHEHYERLIRQLIASGVMLDEGMLYWYARLSAKYPTVEIRIGDVCPSVDDAVLVAALVRAMVATALDDIAAGRPAIRTDHHLLVAAHWRAAHDGLEGEGVDLTDGELRPAWELFDQFVERMRPALERHGDLDEVTDLIGGLRRHGTGAARQRAVLARGGDLVDVVRDVARQTRGSGHP
ncbi:carboxylate-amine ligase [Micromonospora citrea]|uniref:Putative glutamate--cysteine ligase 2 n=1 Tax=Micromonospora citrea TaxID=47855 RepID=A0A1C6VJ83_9ACTN|nr:glutamate--cysteine ligase [Micromonospora citrea]SCL66383.1 carboxylate-amine ligase [Micromonospora citrea]